MFSEQPWRSQEHGDTLGLAPGHSPGQAMRRTSDLTFKDMQAELCSHLQQSPC